MLAACSGGSDDAESEPAASSGEPGESGEPVSGNIRVWTHQNNAFNDRLESLAADFTAANPEVEVSFETFDYDTYVQTLKTSLPAGTEADVLQLFGTWTCSYADNLAVVPDSVSTVAAAQERDSATRTPVSCNSCSLHRS